MRFYDTFLFRDELDMLECRLRELDSSPVYRHVIVEASADHQGHPKPLTFMEHQDRFARWRDRIIYIVADELPAQGAWNRIRAQREETWRGLADAGPDDVVLIADVDEIPSPRVFEMAAHAPFALSQRVSVFAVDWLHPREQVTGVAARYSQLDSSLAAMRDSRDSRISLSGAGWHLSWLGGPAALRAKMASYCHTEMDSYISRGIDAGQFYERGVFWGWGEGDVQLQAADVDDSWPRWIFERKCPEIWFRPRT